MDRRPYLWGWTPALPLLVGFVPEPLSLDLIATNGPQTVWPHDPRTGWSYCVFIPSWVAVPEGKESDGKAINPKVFFEVQVGIQSPDGISTLRPILRRFSDFLKLHAAVKKLFPKKKLPAAPPKNSLMRINSNQALLKERRHTLEDWMGRLLADIDISRSVPLASFLELEAAVRSERQSQLSVTSSIPLQSTSKLRSGVSWTGGGSSVVSHGYSTLDYGSDATYENSVVGTPSKGSEGELEAEMEALALEEQTASIAAAIESRENQQQEKITSVGLISNSSERVGMGMQTRAVFMDYVAADEPSSQNQPPNGQEMPAVTTVNQVGLAGTSLDETSLKSPLSLGSRHRHRTSQESLSSEISSAPGSDLLRGVSMDLHTENPLMSSSGANPSGEPHSPDAESLKGVGTVFPADQRSKVKRVMGTLQRRFLTAKTDMEDLLGRLSQETAVKEFLTTKVRDLESEIDGMRRKSREVLQRAVWAERERMISLQWELDDCRVALQSSEENVQSLQASKGQLEEKLQEVLAKFETMEKELADVNQQYHSLQQEGDSVDAQARAEKKVLAKEVKNLRASHMEIKQEVKQAMQAKASLEAILSEQKQKQEKAQVTRVKFVREIAMLQARLRECNMDELYKRNGSLGRTEASDMVATFESRISLLIGQAQLLVQEDEELRKADSSTHWPSPRLHEESNGDSGVTFYTDKDSEAALRKMLIDAFIEQAQLCRSLNSLTCNALMSKEAT
nr:PX domain-containing protein EREX-like isoform X3 [Physcomitrium patens]|eukprot:XP_024395374.1 PX domain-containing protein EREX-like isoform X3 [Physcomitrella patens]